MEAFYIGFYICDAINVEQLYFLSRLTVPGFYQKKKEYKFNTYFLWYFLIFIAFSISFTAVYTLLLFMYFLPKNLLDLLQFS